MVNHNICYISEIVIAVPNEWLDKLSQTRNPENKSKRLALFSAVKRWVYLSCVLQEETQGVHGSSIRVSILNQIKALKEKEIPRIVSPYEIVYISPEWTLKTGKLVHSIKVSHLQSLISLSSFSNNQVGLCGKDDDPISIPIGNKNFGTGKILQ